jgi:Bacterial regulatory helix-turn-helix protein, lysR family
MLDRLTLDQLRILIAVAETGSFSAAARWLRRVQSAVSKSMDGLPKTAANCLASVRLASNRLWFCLAECTP